MNETRTEAQRCYLLEFGGPTIKHLLSLARGESAGQEFTRNYAALCQMPAVAYWRRNVPAEVQVSTILGSSDTCFENSCGKLLWFGLSADEIFASGVLKRYLSFLQRKRTGDVYQSLARYVVAGYLYVAGRDDDVVREVILGRIEKLHGCVVKFSGGGRIYANERDERRSASAGSKKRIDPQWYSGGEFGLPLIHDIFVLSHFYGRDTGVSKKKIDAIVDLVASEKYQSLDYGYGLIREDGGRSHFMGWSAHLPLFNSALAGDYFKKGLMFRMAIFSRFNHPKIRSWLAEVLHSIEGYRIDDFRYRFPSGLLPEIPNSYFFNGRHTSLNENRRQKVGAIVEATYYAHLAGQHCASSGRESIVNS